MAFGQLETVETLVQRFFAMLSRPVLVVAIWYFGRSRARLVDFEDFIAVLLQVERAIQAFSVVRGCARVKTLISHQLVVRQKAAHSGVQEAIVVHALRGDQRLLVGDQSRRQV